MSKHNNNNNNNEEIFTTFYNNIENFFINIIDVSFIETLVKKSLINDNMNEYEKQLTELFIENDKQLQFKKFRYSFLLHFLIDLAYETDNVQDKPLLKILSTAFINYVRPKISKKIRIYEKESMTNLEKNMLTKFNKKVKHIILKEIQENTCNNDNFIKNVYLDSFNNILIVYESYSRIIGILFFIISKMIILIFLFPLLYKLKYGLIQNIFNVSFASLYNIYVVQIFENDKSKKITNDLKVDLKENKLKNILHSFFENIDIIVQSDTLEKELNDILKHTQNILHIDNGAILHKYQSAKYCENHIKNMAKYKIIDTVVSLVINDIPILVSLDSIKQRILNYVEEKGTYRKKINVMSNFINILNIKPYHISKTIAWDNNDKSKHIFVLKNITLEYQNMNGNLSKILENVTLNFERKRSHFITGNSGCGKSSLMHALMKRFKYSNGTISFLDKYENYDYFCIRDYIIYMTSESALFHKSVYYNITYQINKDIILGEKKEEIDGVIQKYVTIFGLGKYSSNLKTKNAKTLSKGETQRVAIIRLILGIMYNKTRILLLDEITSNIDNNTEDVIFTELRRLQKIYKFTIIYISHNPYLIKYSDYKYIIDTTNHSILKIANVNES
jgi:putative ABC transport system ATP-binding protein